MRFEWDHRKRATTILKHGIDMVDAAEIFASDHVILDGNNELEPRKLAIGLFEGYFIALVFVERGEYMRLITARKARRNERRTYSARYPGRDPQNEKPD